MKQQYFGRDPFANKDKKRMVVKAPKANFELARKIAKDTKPKQEYIARLVVYELDTMKTKEYKRLLTWLDARYEEAQKPDYLKKYSKRYVARLMK